MRRIVDAARELVGWANLFGAAVFISLTAVLWALFYDHIDAAKELILFLLAVVATGFLFRQTRRVAAGFVLAFAIMTPLNPRFTRLWWEHIVREATRATRPLTRGVNAREQFRAWMDSRRGYPVELKDALVLIRNLQSGCVPSYSSLERAPAPTDVAAILRKTDCDRFEPMLVKSKATYPQRYYKSDTGWRWDYARDSDSNGGGRVVLRPDPLLGLPGPILEVTLDGWYRIRQSETAPLTMLRTPVPMMKRLRECIPLAAAEVEPRYYPILWEYLSNKSYLNRVCRDLIVDEDSSVKEGGRIIFVTRAGAEPDPLGRTMLQHLALSPGRFEIRAWSFGRRYLLDADGVLHAANALGLGTMGDGPPLPCEIEPGRSCG